MHFLNATGLTQVLELLPVLNCAELSTSGCPTAILF